MERRESLGLRPLAETSDVEERTRLDRVRSLSRPGMLLPVLGWYAILFFIPLLLLIRISVADITNFQLRYVWTSVAYHNLFSNALNFQLLRRSLFLASGVTLLTLVLGLPAAWIIARRPPRQRQLLMLLLIIPWWSSYIVRIFAWRMALGTHGILNSFLLWVGIIRQPLDAFNFGWTGIVIAETNLYLPLMVVPLYMSIERLDPDLIRAARSLGASRLRTFVRVFLPLITPGLLTGILFVFMPMTGEFIVPTLIGAPGNVLYGSQIASDFGTSFAWNDGAALAVLLLAVLLVVATVLRMLAGRVMRNLRRV